MATQTESWLDSMLSLHGRLTTAVIGLIESLLSGANIDFLTVTGRTKSKAGCLEKIERKSYSAPHAQLTDVSGLRIIVYTESQVQRVSDLISGAFNVDKKNSMDRDSALRVDQTGYRSVHFVCDLGSQRAALPEFSKLGGLKFEIQVRTVLQHAWAELAHDRNYKLGAKLPRDLERRLYLYAGMLEIADKGFDDISRQIDEYVVELRSESKDALDSVVLDSLSMGEFFTRWSEGSDVELVEMEVSPDVIDELNTFGIQTIGDLKAIEPVGFSDRLKEFPVGRLTATGVARLWMLISDWRKIVETKKIAWRVSKGDRYARFLSNVMSAEDLAALYASFDGDRRAEFQRQGLKKVAKVKQKRSTSG